MTTTIHVARGVRLPLEAITQTFAIVAKREAGKTYTAKVLAEGMVDAGGQIIAIDPTGVWWGLRASADGNGPGLPIYVFGGEHGDIPLEPGSGAMVADTIVDSGISVVLDVSPMSKTNMRTFITAFGERLYERKSPTAQRTPLHIFIDEADLFVPQRDFRGVERMLGAMEDLVRRGRSRGIGVTLISQRPQAVNKSVLTQCEVLVALRLIHQLDRKAVDAWVEAHDVEGRRQEFMDSLASLGIGQAWFWSPGWLDMFKLVTVRPLKTFDSSATPKAGEQPIEPRVLAAVDIDALRDQMAQTIEQAEANDPKKLRAEMARLRAEVARLEQAPPAIDGDALAESAALRDENNDLRSQVLAHKLVADTLGQAVREGRSHMIVIGELIRTSVVELEETMERVRDAAIPEAPARQPAPAPTHAPTPTPVPARATATAPAGAVAGEEEVTLKKVERKILTVLAQHPDGMGRDKIAMFTGYIAGAGGFGNGIGACRTAGWIEGVRGSPLRITEAGRGVLGNSWEPLPSGAELIIYWMNHDRMLKPGKLILRTLYDHYPRTFSAVELAEIHDYTHGTGGFNNGIGRARSLGLIKGPASALELSDDLQEAVFSA